MTQENLVLTKDAQELVDLSKAMKRLEVNPDFARLKAITEKQISVWTTLAMARTEGNDVYRSEWQKGVAYGITLNLETPSRIIKDATDILFRMEKPNGRSPDLGSGVQPDLFGTEPRRDTPEHIAEQLDEPVGPDARVTADSN